MANLKLLASQKAMLEAIAAATGVPVPKPAPASTPAAKTPPAPVKSPGKSISDELTKQFEEKLAEPEPEKPKRKAKEKAHPLTFARPTVDEFERPLMVDEDEDAIHTAILHGLALGHGEALANMLYPPIYGVDDIAVKCVAYGNGYLMGLVNSEGATFGQVEYHSSDRSKDEAWGEWAQIVQEVKRVLKGKAVDK